MICKPQKESLYINFPIDFVTKTEKLNYNSLGYQKEQPDYVLLYSRVYVQSVEKTHIRWLLS